MTTNVNSTNLDSTSLVGRAVAAVDRYQRARSVREEIGARLRPALLLAVPGPEHDSLEAQVGRAIQVEIRAERAAITAIRRAAQGKATETVAMGLGGGRLVVVLPDPDNETLDLLEVGGQIQIVDRLVTALAV